MHADDGSTRLKVRELLALADPSTISPTAVRQEHLRRDRLGRWDRVELDTTDGDTIPCLLITPDHQLGLDVVAVHQHAGSFSIGKSEPAGLAGDPSLAYGRALVHAGARVILPDLIGFEERQRRWSGDAGADERLDALFRVANGSSLQAKHTRDIAAVTTWMQESKAGSDQTGVIGHSLGGQVALAVDPRISRGVVSCGLGTLASFEAERIEHNPAWFVPGLGARGDVGIVASAVDQPVYVAAGLDDGLFPIEGVQEVLGAFQPDLLTADLFEGGHSMPAHVLESAVRHLVSPPIDSSR